MPEGADFLASPGQPLTGATTTELAVAEVGHADILQIAPQDRRVGLDGVRGDPEVARTVVGAGAEVDGAFEGNAKDDDAGVRVRSPARDEAWVGLLHLDTKIFAGRPNM
jgi:hypothetical protein